MKVLGNNVLIKVARREEKTKSGLIIPDVINQGSLPERGEVVMVGEDVESIEVGSVVIFKRYAASDVEIDGIKHVVVDAEEVLLIL